MASHRVKSANKHIVSGPEPRHIISSMDENGVTFREEGFSESHKLDHGQAARYARALNASKAEVQRAKAADTGDRRRRSRPRPRRKAD